MKTMKTRDLNVCIMRVGGTNCDEETKRAFDELGVSASVVKINELIRRRRLMEYDGLVIPGGFSFGDYVRAGAIWADVILEELGGAFRAFVAEKRPILGICNGFQVLVETGLLPRLGGGIGVPEVVLANNLPIGYRCTWVYLKHESSGKCVFTRRIPRNKVLRIPIAHGEGRLMVPIGEEDDYLKKLRDNDQIVLRYAKPSGEDALGEFPYNPNGSLYDIAGVCDPSGRVFGLMPHPERAYFGWQLPDWTGMQGIPRFGDGRLIFQSMVEYLEEEY